MLLSVKFLSPFPSYYSYIGHAAIYFRIYKSLEKLIISLRTQSGEIERESELKGNVTRNYIILHF